MCNIMQDTMYPIYIHIHNAISCILHISTYCINHMYFSLDSSADSPVMISFPHFYLADPKLREAVEGMSEPDPEKHSFWLDVQPVSNGPL